MSYGWVGGLYEVAAIYMIIMLISHADDFITHPYDINISLLYDTDDC